MHAVQRSPIVQRTSTFGAAAALVLSLAACGGGGDSDATETTDAQGAAQRREAAAVSSSGNTLSIQVLLPGFPHPIDIYRPAGATRAVVFLHGHGGRSQTIAYSFGLNRNGGPPTMTSVNWDWLTKNKIIAVFPQGQAAPGSTITTWSNHLADSGEDDVAFLAALSQHLRTQLGAASVALAGHSMGGVMTSRIWCEATDAFDAYVSLAGPTPSHYFFPQTPCAPSANRPHLVFLGGQDTVFASILGAGDPEWTPTPDEAAAGLTNQILVNEWAHHENRSRSICGATPSLAASGTATGGRIWRDCDASVTYRVVDQADHPIPSLEQYTGIRMIDAIASLLGAP